MSGGHVERKATWQTYHATSLDRGDLGASNKTEPFEAHGAPTSVHAILEGTPTGTVKLFASADWKSGQTDKWNGTWEDITARVSPAIVNPAGAGASYLVDLQGIRAKAYYFDYARAGGAGTARATWISALT